MIDINHRPQAPRRVIFDIDGTLVDSNDAHAHAWVDALAEAGHHVAFTRVRPLIGMGGDKVLPELVGMDENSPEGKPIAERRGEIFRTRYFPAVRGLPGAQELVALLVREGHALAVASSARKAPQCTGGVGSGARSSRPAMAVKSARVARQSAQPSRCAATAAASAAASSPRR